MTQCRRRGTLLAFERRGDGFNRRLRLAGGRFVDVGVDAGTNEFAYRGGQRLVEQALTLVLRRTDHIEPEVHAHSPKTFRTTVFARRVTRR